jgi:alkanesulfonate monooxygenase SsuD/methylene tetrahydromethanopterin reductase-like flavin-dependent oxidoreductase (luciferase family)
MRIAIGLPTRQEPGQRDHVLAWAAAADVGPFSSLAVGDRVVAPAHEALALLAACCAVTRRIGLMASLIVGPVRETTLLGRQAATIDVLSSGRLSLGLGVGAREDDYRATGTPFRGRGRQSERQLAELRRIWRGEAPDPDGESPAGRIGIPPFRPEGPELLLGGYVPTLAGRIAAFADGFMAPGGADPIAIAALWKGIEAAWTEAGREGRPRMVAGSYFALGPEAAVAAKAYIDAYYGYDPKLAARRLDDLPTTPEAVLAVIRRTEELGADELILRPVRADHTMRERLADVLTGG